MTAIATGRAELAVCEQVTVVHGDADSRVEALVDADLVLHSGEAVSLLGPSGSGKTTLLHVIGGLVIPTSGVVSWRGQRLSTLDAAARGRARARGIAYVFQGSNLLPHFTAIENVTFAHRAVQRAREAGPTPDELLALVGLSAKAGALPAELSGGEAQRVAIARALGQRPELLLCDEPTGHLDSDTGRRVLDMVDALQAELGFTLLTATHDADVAARATATVTLLDGRVAKAA